MYLHIIIIHVECTSYIELSSGVHVHCLESQLRVRMLKENLAISRTQLHCKREALKRLYFDDVKHKLMLKLLDQV